jgi:hypothetical protein
MKKQWRSLLIGVVGIFVVSGVSHTAYACSIAPPEPWFTEHAALDPTITLPAGVDIHVTGEGDLIEFRNTSDTELFITGKLHGVFWDDEPSNFPQAGNPSQPILHRLVSGKAFSWGFVQPAPDKEPTTQRPYAPHSITAQVSRGWVVANEALLAEYADHNKTADGRPSDVAIPPPQQITLHFVYGSDNVAIPLTIAYKLNPDYDPQGEQHYEEAMAACIEQTQLMSAAAVANENASPVPTEVSNAVPAAAKNNSASNVLWIMGVVTAISIGVIVQRRKAQ